MTLQEFLDSVEDDKIFTVEFIKRTNGERRTMNCRRGVKKGVTGKGMNFDPKKKNLLVVFDMQKAAFRMVNLEDLIFLKAHGKCYSWNISHERFYEVLPLAA